MIVTKHLNIKTVLLNMLQHAHKNNIEKQMRTHHKISTLECIACDQTFENKNKIDEHIRANRP